jgi:hypothetical protein
MLSIIDSGSTDQSSKPRRASVGATNRAMMRGRKAGDPGQIARVLRLTVSVLDDVAGANAAIARDALSWFAGAEVSDVGCSLAAAAASP